MKHKFSIGVALFSVSTVVVLAATGCGSDDKKAATPTTPAPTVTFADISPIIASKCATSGCHDGTTSPNYKTVTESTWVKSDVVPVSGGTMPKSPTTLTADEKTKLTGFVPKK